MTIFVRLALGFIGAAVPVLAMAAPPNVTGITAVNEDGKVRVTWTPLPGEIDDYRIFYSHTSILGNAGLYDDFESVDGTVTTHLLQNVPPVDELYISILAVDASGEESPYFLEEARVELNAGGSSSSASQGDVGVLRLISVEPISATGVTLTFSHPVSIPQEQAMEAIMIDSGSGKMLRMRRYIIEGNTVTVHTAPQERGIAYRVTVGEMVMGTVGTATLPLANDQTPVLFMGHPTGIEPVMTSSQSSSTQTSSVPDVMQFRLRAQPEGTTYTVEATWQAPAGTITGYSVAQTTDGGRTYDMPRTVDKSALAIKMPGVPPGQFGLLIKVIGADGVQSRGIAQLITLPAPQGGVLPGMVVPMPDGKGDGTLPDSGPALWFAVSGLGGLAGAWNLRRGRKQRTA